MDGSASLEDAALACAQRITSAIATCVLRTITLQESLSCHRSAPHSQVHLIHKCFHCLHRGLAPRPRWTLWASPTATSGRGHVNITAGSGDCCACHSFCMHHSSVCPVMALEGEGLCRPHIEGAGARGGRCCPSQHDLGDPRYRPAGGKSPGSHDSSCTRLRP